MSEISKKYILNAIELYKSQINENYRDMSQTITNTFPRKNDFEPIPAIMDQIKSVLPNGYGVKWGGKKYDCCKERFYVELSVYIDTSEIEVYNEKSREEAETKLKELHHNKIKELNAWNAEAWLSLANGKEIPIFNPSVEFELSVSVGEQK